MGRDPLRQLQKGARPSFLILGELLDAFPSVHAAERAMDGNEDGVGQHVPLAAYLARIWNRGKVLGRNPCRSWKTGWQRYNSGESELKKDSR
jgi:hypothetical protein